MIFGDECFVCGCVGFGLFVEFWCVGECDEVVDVV